ncbi:MAG: hypothetical protein KDA72_20655, partial [Planctomycetales bacterium]|nr:hypothetical protein [Planctomycetales bacterium]
TTYYDTNNFLPGGQERVKHVWDRVKQTLNDGRFLDDGKHGAGPLGGLRYNFFGNKVNPWVWNIPLTTRGTSYQPTFYTTEIGTAYKNAPDFGSNSRTSAILAPVLYWGNYAAFVYGGQSDWEGYANSRPILAVGGKNPDGGGNVKPNIYNYIFYAESFGG